MARDIVRESEYTLSTGDQVVLPDGYERKETSLPGGGFQGLYTRQALPSGYRIGVYMGELIHSAEANRRSAYFTQDHRWNEVVYFFDIELEEELIRSKVHAMYRQSPFLRDQYSRIGMPKSFVIDGYRMGSFVRFTNASLNPAQQNCRFVREEEYVYLVTTRAIPADTELITSYGVATDSLIFANPSMSMSTVQEGKMFEMMVGRDGTGRVGSIPWIRRIASAEFDDTTSNQFHVYMNRKTSTLGEEILIEPAEDPRTGFILYKSDLIEKGFLVIENTEKHVHFRFRNINDIFYDDTYPNGRYRMVLRLMGGRRPGVEERHFILANSQEDAETYVPGAANNQRPAAEGIDEEALYNYRMVMGPESTWGSSDMAAEMGRYIREYEAQNRATIKAALDIRNREIRSKRKKPEWASQFGGYRDYRPGSDPAGLQPFVRTIKINQMPASTYQIQPLPSSQGMAYRPLAPMNPEEMVGMTSEEFDTFTRDVLSTLSSEEQAMEFHAERVRRDPEYRQTYEQLKLRTRQRFMGRRTRKKSSKRRLGPDAASSSSKKARGGDEQAIRLNRELTNETYEYRRAKVPYEQADKTDSFEMHVDGLMLSSMRHVGRPPVKPLIPIELLRRSRERRLGPLLEKMQRETCSYYGIPVYTKTNSESSDLFVSVEDLEEAGVMARSDVYGLLDTNLVVFYDVDTPLINTEHLKIIEPDPAKRHTMIQSMAPSLHSDSYKLSEVEKALGRPIGPELFAQLWEIGVIYAYAHVNFGSVQKGQV